MLNNSRFSRSHRRIFKFAALSLIAVLALSMAALPLTNVSARETFPSSIPLPNGFQPEGIAIGRGSTFFVGSIPTGAIYKGDLRTGEGSVFIPAQTGRMAIGLAYDPRSDYLYVSGGPTGAAYVYDATSGALIAEYQFAPANTTFINDAVVTRTGVYFTSSFTPYLYRVPLGPAGELSGTGFQAIELVGDYIQGPGFGANGIDATPNGKWLVVVSSSLGTLYRVNPWSGDATLIDLDGGDVTNGDGILLSGKTLYVVQNANNQVSVVDLNPDLTSGSIVDVLASSAFRVPTTVDRFGDALYIVNARFDTPPTPDTDYNVVRVEISH